MNVFDFLFENSSKLQKLFLVAPDTLTHNDLYLRALSLSDHIRNTVGSGNNLILVSPNNAFFLTVYLAILKSGNTVVPLDPAIEADGFDYIRNITESPLLYVVPQIKNRLQLNESDCMLPTDLPPPAKGTLASEEPDFDAESVAEIIFTSGSTGTPKGVVLTHKNLIANTSSIIEYLHLTEDDRMLVVLPFYYCYGLSLLHTHLRVGASLVFNNSFIFLGAVTSDLKDYACTGFAGVPSHFQILLRKSETFKSTQFHHLKYVTQAGGKLAPVFIEEFRASHPDVKFIVMYGQTEATARLSHLPPDLCDRRKGSIGKGIPGVELRVVDEQDNDVAPDEVGEVIARGDNVMKGYYRDEAATLAVIKKGWLYTGDLGTVDHDGLIYLTARKKEIIKVGGRRISPKEIEAVIMKLPQVVDCSIDAVDDELLGEALRATVVVSSCGKEKLNGEIVKEHCTSHLALFKVPGQYTFVEQMTVSATGKHKHSTAGQKSGRRTDSK